MRAIASAGDSPVVRARLRARDAVDRVAQRAGVAAVYHTSVGVKQINQLFKSGMYDAYTTGRRVAVDPAKLRLGFDALRDEYTLLETTIDASPHLALVRSLLEPGREPAWSYIDRVRRGTLDWRPPQRVSPGLLAYIRRLFAARLEQVDCGEPTVVRVAWVDHEPYIVDGCHRAAVAFMRGREVLCEDVSGVYGDSYFRWISTVVSRRPSCHQTHLRFWGRVQRQIERATGGEAL